MAMCGGHDKSGNAISKGCQIVCHSVRGKVEAAANHGVDMEAGNAECYGN